MKLVQTVLALIDGSLWESIPWGTEDSTMGFVIVPYQDGAFTRYLEAGPFMSNSIFPHLPVPCLWDDEELRWAGELV